MRYFDIYGVDVLHLMGVAETGTQRKYSAVFKKTVVTGLEKKEVALYVGHARSISAGLVSDVDT